MDFQLKYSLVLKTSIFPIHRTINKISKWKNKSIFYGDNKIAQELLDKFAGKGTTVIKNKERVDFGKPIGKYYDTVTGQYIETNRGMIHYGKDGAHIVPAKLSE